MKSSATWQFCPNCAWNARVVSSSAKYDLSGQNKVDSRCCQVLLDSYPGPELQGWAFFQAIARLYGCTFFMSQWWPIHAAHISSYAHPSAHLGLNVVIIPKSASAFRSLLGHMRVYSCSQPLNVLA